MVAPPTLNRLTVAAAVDSYLATMRRKVVIGQVSPRTYGIYSHDLADFRDLAGPDTVLDDITGEDMDGIVAAFASIPDRRRKAHAQAARTGAVRPGAPQKSASSQALFHTSVTAFLSTAEHQGWVQVSPMHYAQLRPAKRKHLRVERSSLSLDQAQALIEHGAGEIGPETTRRAEHNIARDRCVFSLMVVLGPRVSEVASADLDELSPTADGGASWTILGKGGKQRRVPLSASLYAQFREYQQVRARTVPGAEDCPAAFVSSRGNRVDAQSIQRALTAAQKRLAGREDTRALARGMTPHALRHTAATLMLASGWDIKVVAELLGHENISTTSRYLDQIPGELEAAIAAHPLGGQLASREAADAVAEV